MSTRIQLLSRFILTTSLLVALIAGLVPTAAQDDTPWPTNSWLTSTPEEQGMDSAQLLALLDEIETKGYTLDSLMVIRHGRVVLNTYFWPYQQGVQHALYSATKSFTSALIGVAMQQGFIESVTQPVLELLPGYKAADPRWEEVTLRDVLTMSAGFDCGPDLLTVDHLRQAGDWTQAMLDAPITFTPGTAWVYCQVYSHLLSSIVHGATGVPSAQFAREQLFTPLGISDYAWQEDPQGNVTGHSQLRLTTPDMAKLGYLYLHGGRWEDRQIIPEEFVRDSVCGGEETAYCVLRGTDTDHYGYQWWVPRVDTHTFQMRGFSGQLVMVLPERDMLVVSTAHDISDYGSPVAELLASSIARISTSDSQLPDNPEGLVALQQRVAALAQPGSVEPVSPPPASARVNLGRWLAPSQTVNLGERYHIFDEFWLVASDEVPPLQAFRVSEGADDSEALLSLRFADGYDIDMRVGMDGVYRLTECRYGTLAAKGSWTERWGGFAADFHLVGGGMTERLDAELGKARVWVHIGSPTWYKDWMISTRALD